MAKADRLNRLDDRRSLLEVEYGEALTAALRRTASGKKGLFGHDGDRRAREAIAPVLENLSELGEAIDKLREQLAMPPFDLHRMFLASRGPVSADAVGEAKQAQAWLDRLSGPARDPAS